MHVAGLGRAYLFLVLTGNWTVTLLPRRCPRAAFARTAIFFCRRLVSFCAVFVQTFCFLFCFCFVVCCCFWCCGQGCRCAFGCFSCFFVCVKHPQRNAVHHLVLACFFCTFLCRHFVLLFVNVAFGVVAKAVVVHLVVLVVFVYVV